MFSHERVKIPFVEGRGKCIDSREVAAPRPALELKREIKHCAINNCKTSQTQATSDLLPNIQKWKQNRKVHYTIFHSD